MEAAIPNNEEARLDSLYQYEILDTPAEPVYDDITLIASTICGMPISAISLVDKNRQWFKAIIGLDAKQTPRSEAFCAHAILDNQTLVINDALQDERFSDNKLVLSDPGIRFYAGAPITTPDGNALGTLCVIDQKANALNDTQIKALEALARQVAVLLELRIVGLKARREEVQKTALLAKELLLDNAAAGVVLVKNRVIQHCNFHFEQMFGYHHGELVGKNTRIFYRSEEEYNALGISGYEKLKAGDLSPTHITCQRKDNTTFPATISGYAIDVENPLAECVLTIANIA
jgi:PAS domain S-box-containing protein